MKHNPPTPPALEKPHQPGGIRAVFLAVFVHAAFFALIVFGVAWQSSPTPPVEAEIWDKLPPVARAPEKKADPPREPPKPETLKPEPPKPEVKPPPPKPDPAIAQKLEREKREKEKAEKHKRERLEKQKEDEAKKKREQEEAAKKKLDDDKKRVEDERARREAQKTREAAAVAKQNEITRYVDAIKAKIRSRANVPDTVTGNPQVHVRIRILPGGEVLEIAITRRSANPSYDAAIERAIRSAQPLPVPPADSELFPQFRDLNLQIRHER